MEDNLKSKKKNPTEAEMNIKYFFMFLGSFVGIWLLSMLVPLFFRIVFRMGEVALGFDKKISVVSEGVPSNTLKNFGSSSRTSLMPSSR